MSDRIRSRVGPGADLSDGSLLGQLTGALSLDLAEHWDRVEALRDSVDPDAAVRAELEQLALISGFSREEIDAIPDVTDLRVAVRAEVSPEYAETSARGIREALMSAVDADGEPIALWARVIIPDSDGPGGEISIAYYPSGSIAGWPDSDTMMADLIRSGQVKIAAAVDTHADANASISVTFEGLADAVDYGFFDSHLAAVGNVAIEIDIDGAEIPEADIFAAAIPPAAKEHVPSGIYVSDYGEPLYPADVVCRVAALPSSPRIVEVRIGYVGGTLSAVLPIRPLPIMALRFDPADLTVTYV